MMKENKKTTSNINKQILGRLPCSGEASKKYNGKNVT